MSDLTQWLIRAIAGNIWTQRTLQLFSQDLRKEVVKVVA